MLACGGAGGGWLVDGGSFAAEGGVPCAGSGGWEGLGYLPKRLVALGRAAQVVVSGLRFPLRVDSLELPRFAVVLPQFAGAAGSRHPQEPLSGLI